jgi:hypothetical protein
MNKKKLNQTYINRNLIGEKEHREFICFMSEYAIAVRGGCLPPFERSAAQLLCSDEEFLSSSKRRQQLLLGITFQN